MLFGWFRRRRRRRLRSHPFPEPWRDALERHLPHWSRLPAERQRQLEGIVQVLVAEKSWEGCGGLEMTDEVKVVVGAQAGTLLLGIEHDYYRNVDAILVYPTGYTLPTQNEFGARSDRAVLGHAQLYGPVVLSWRSALSGGHDADDGRNLVYHEFAHKLDMLDDLIDGTPPLKTKADYREWIEVMTRHFEALQQSAARGGASLLDPYGAQDVGEFFAVGTEAFFERARAMQRRNPDLYGVLQSFYGQDPASWQD